MAEFKSSMDITKPIENTTANYSFTLIFNTKPKTIANTATIK